MLNHLLLACRQLKTPKKKHKTESTVNFSLTEFGSLTFGVTNLILGFCFCLSKIVAIQQVHRYQFHVIYFLSLQLVLFARISRNV